MYPGSNGRVSRAGCNEPVAGPWAPRAIRGAAHASNGPCYSRAFARPARTTPGLPTHAPALRLLHRPARGRPCGVCQSTLPTLIFPVVGGSTYYEDDFGDPRPQGSHEGNDLLAPRNTPVVAAEDGVVRPYVSGRGGLMLYLRSKTREYLYIRLFNDRGPEDSDLGGPRDGLRAGHQGACG